MSQTDDARFIMRHPRWAWGRAYGIVFAYRDRGASRTFIIKSVNAGLFAASAGEVLIYDRRGNSWTPEEILALDTIRFAPTCGEACLRHAIGIPVGVVFECVDNLWRLEWQGRTFKAKGDAMAGAALAELAAKHMRAT